MAEKKKKKIKLKLVLPHVHKKTVRTRKKRKVFGVGLISAKDFAEHGNRILNRKAPKPKKKKPKGGFKGRKTIA